MCSFYKVNRKMILSVLMDLHGDDQRVDVQPFMLHHLWHSCHEQSDSADTSTNFIIGKDISMTSILQLFYYVDGYTQLHHTFNSHHSRFRKTQSVL